MPAVTEPRVSRRVAMGAVIGVAVLALVFALMNLPAAPPVFQRSDATPEQGPMTTIPEGLTLHVSGAVTVPGLVVVMDGGRVADAIAAAGGATAGADLAAVNLAAEVVDGMHLRIPLVGEQTAASAWTSGATADGRVDLNSASAADLTRLPGVGPVLAARIVAHRDAEGPFESVEDLLDVSGIGEGKLASIRDAAAVP